MPFLVCSSLLPREATPAGGDRNVLALLVLCTGAHEGLIRLDEFLRFTCCLLMDDNENGSGTPSVPHCDLPYSFDRSRPATRRRLPCADGITAPSRRPTCTPYRAFLHRDPHEGGHVWIPSRKILQVAAAAPRPQRTLRTRRAMKPTRSGSSVAFVSAAAAAAAAASVSYASSCSHSYSPPVSSRATPKTA